MLPKVTRMLDLVTVVMLLLTAGYIFLTFFNLLSQAVSVTLIGGAIAYGFGYCKNAATVRELRNKPGQWEKEYIA